MEVYLLRHGIAEDRSETGHDTDRRLTDEGRTKLRHVMERAHSAGVQPSLILSSPLRRALETAEIAAHQLGYEGKIVRIAALTPDSSPEQIWNSIREYSAEPSLLLAGHEPLFSAAVAHFLGSTRSMVNFRKGALIRIDFEGVGNSPAGVLQWMITPKVA
jgi:phosphohistidine phosphatase